MDWNRKETWLTLIVLALGAVVTLIVGLPMYMKSTATLLHPDPQTAPAATQSDPSQQWTAAGNQSRQTLRTALSERNLPGLSVAVGIDGNIVWAEGFGWADIDQRSPITPETRFRIGSASKVLTSAAVGLLVEKQRLNLDQEIQSYVPQFPKKPWPVTLRMLMAHTSGIRNDGGDEGPLFGRHCERPIDGLPDFGDRELLFEPRTEYRYSNYGWILISAAVESAANQPFLTFMRQSVFEPLGMNDTTADAPTAEPPNTATFYFPRFAADPRYGLHLMRPLDLSCYAGSMAFLSTPSDLVRFGMAMNDGKLLQPATVRLLQTSQRLTSGKDTGYGLGWDLEPVTLAGQQTQSVGHDGESLGGNVVSLITFPERRMAIAVMSNISYADTNSLALKVAEAFAVSVESGR